jgi:hypothetical protein
MRPPFPRLDWLVCFLAGTSIVHLGVAFGREFVRPAPPYSESTASHLQSLINWDGAYYRDIAAFGPSYTPQQQSTVHFFPFYPLVGWCAKTALGLSAESALVLTSHVCLAAALFLFGYYVDVRVGPTETTARLGALLAIAFIPSGFFFRMAYAESLFLLLVISQLYLIERRASPLAVAVVAGLASATRPVGLALLGPLLLYLARTASSRKALLTQICILVPIGVGGLLVFMVYCFVNFDDPLVFARDRMSLWTMRRIPDLPEKIAALATLYPVWTIFDPSSPAFWGRYATPSEFIFSLYVANPLYFIAALALLTVGLRKEWLNGYETLMTVGLLLIPYWMTSYEIQMTGVARFVSVNAPLYLVVGRLAARGSQALNVGLVALCSFWLAAYAALFARWYWLV